MTVTETAAAQAESAQRPLVVGLGGTLRTNSSTERAVRHCLQSVEREGGRIRMFAGPDLDLPMYAPHQLERTPTGTRTRRRAARRRRRGGRVAGLPRRRVRAGEERARLHRGPARGRAGVPRQHTVGLHQLRLRVAGRGRARWGSCGRSGTRCGPGRHRSAWRSTRPTGSGTSRANSSTSRCAISSTCWPARCSPSPGPQDHRVTFTRRSTTVDGLVTSVPRGRRRRPGGAAARRRVRRHRRDRLGAHRSPLWPKYRVLAPDMLGFGELGQGGRLHRRPRDADPPHRPLLRDARRRLPRTSSATRWVRSTCSSTPRRRRRCSRCAALTAICGGGEIQRNETFGRALRLRRHACRRCDGSSRRSSPIPRIPPTTSTCSGATSPASRRERGKRWRRRGSAGRAWSRRRCRRVDAPTTASRVPTLVVEGGSDKLLPAGWAAEIAGQIAGARSRGRRRRRALPTDRATRGGQRPAVGLPGRRRPREVPAS